jgi:hypothetical protein
MTDWALKVRAELADTLTAKGIEQWLHAHNRYLKGERPIDVLARGDGKFAYEAAIAFSEGIYL